MSYRQEKPYGLRNRVIKTMVSGKVVGYVIGRIFQCLVVIFISTTVVFIIPNGNGYEPD